MRLTCLQRGDDVDVEASLSIRCHKNLCSNGGGGRGGGCCNSSSSSGNSSGSSGVLVFVVVVVIYSIKSHLLL